MVPLHVVARGWMDLIQRDPDRHAEGGPGVMQRRLQVHPGDRVAMAQGRVHRQDALHPADGVADLTVAVSDHNSPPEAYGIRG